MEKLNSNRIVEESDLFKKTDWSSIIKQGDIDEAVGIIQQIINNGDYWTNSPKYQTKENLFARQELCWLKFRMSFITSVFLALGREAQVGNMQAWSFMTRKEDAEDREKLWHNHWHPKQPNGKMMSGIFYLKIPEDVQDRKLCGTEFAPNGPDSSNRFFVPPSDFHWIVYPSNLYHRPGIPQSSDYRFILAADIEYK